MPEGGTGWDETSTSYRYRLRDPDDFQKDSFRTIPLKGVEGISMVMGRLKGETTMTPQSVIFSKEKWTEERAREWMEEHRDSLTSKSFNIEVEIKTDKMLHNRSKGEESIIYFPITKRYSRLNKAIGEKERFIEGYASTDSFDRVGDSISPEAFRPGMESFMRNPIVLFNHDFDRPIGKVVDYRIDKDRLWIKVEIARGTRDVDEVWSLIEQGVLNAFSVATTHGIIGEIDDEKRNRINRWDLAEISVVTVPANEEALFNVSKVKILKSLKKEMEKEMGKEENRKLEEEEEEEEEEKDQKSLKKDLEGIPTSKAIADVIMKSAEREVRERMGEYTRETEDEKTEKQIQRVKTQIEVKLAEQALEIIELKTTLAKIQTGKKDMWPDGSRIQVISKFARAGFKSLGDLQLLNYILRSGGNMPSEELQKAMDVATAYEGAEFVRTDLASMIWETVRQEAKIAGTLNTVEMPSDPFKLPIESTLPTMHYVGESKTYNASDFPEHSPATADQTLTAKKFAIHSMYSGELNEDSVIPVLPFIRNQLAKSAVHGIDNVILNGDIVATATGNINLDDQTPLSTNNYLAMDGLRKLALVTNSANASADASITTLTAAGFLLLRGLMAGWGIDPADLIIVVDYGTYLKTIALSEVETLENYGPNATILKGELAKLYGIPILVSDEMSKTEADGKVCKTPASNTKGQICIYNKQGWMLGWRRHLKVEVERIISTDQYRIVGTLRFALVNFDTEVSAVGYNITV